MFKTLIKRVSRVRGFIKTLDNILFPEFEQTEDNAYSKDNAYENMILSEEFLTSWKKMQEAKKLIAEYEYYKAAREEGLLITEKERQQRAEATYNLWLDCNFIQKGEIVPGILEYMTDLINS